MPLIIDRFTGPPTEPVQEIPAMRARHPAAVAYDIYRTYRRWSPARPPCRPVTNRGATARRDRASKVGNNGRRLACPIDRPVPRVTVVIGSDGRYLRLPVSVPTRSDRYVPDAVSGHRGGNRIACATPASGPRPAPVALGAGRPRRSCTRSGSAPCRTWPRSVARGGSPTRRCRVAGPASAVNHRRVRLRVMT